MNPIIPYYVGFSLGGFYILWILYLAVMSLKRARDGGTLSRFGVVLGIPVLFIGWFVDFLVNVFVMTLIMLELPKEMTVTARLKRHNQTSTGYRLAVVKWFEPLLDPFDPSGDHV